MRHQDLTINHRLESWVYANAAARTSATGFVTGDVGRISFQTDTGQYWRLMSTAPAWQLLVPPVPAPVYGSLQTGQISPAGTTIVAPGVMMGLAGVITPTATGKILVTIAGTLANTVANKNPACNIRYGTGTAPANGASGNTGTPIGGAGILTGNIVNNGSPFSLSALITGAALGVPLWFDLALWTSPAGIALILDTTVTATELP